MKYYPLILSMMLISLYICKLAVDPSEQDACESTYNPKGWEECKGKGTYTPEEVCCFLRGTRPDIKNQTYCADIIIKNISTPEGRKNVEELIKNGTYWEDMTLPFKLEEMICYDSDIPTPPPTPSSANKLVSSILILILVLLL